MADLAEDVTTVLLASRVFADITAEAVAGAGDGISSPQLRVLVLASRSETLNNAAVAEALDVHISNASRICDRLVLAGLLHRRDAPGNRRQVELTLTPRGSALVTAVLEHRREQVSAILTSMSPPQRSSVATALASFTRAAGEHRNSTPMAAVSL